MEISATGAALVYTDLKKHSDIDTCSTTLLMGNDTMALTEWSRYASYGYDIAAEVIGTEGIISMRHSQDDSITLRTRDEHAPGVIDFFRDAYKAEVEAFAIAIKDA